MLPTREDLYARHFPAAAALAWTRDQNLEFQVLNWHATDEQVEREDAGDLDDDEEEEDDPSTARKTSLADLRYVLRAFGVTRAGQSVCLRIDSFTPYFFVKVPPYLLRSERRGIVLRAIEAHLQETFVTRGRGGRSVRHVQRKDFWGFTDGTQFDFIRLTFHSRKAMQSAAYKLRQPQKIANVGQSVRLLLYEANIDPLLRFLHVQDIQPVGWLAVPSRDLREATVASDAAPEQRGCRCQISARCHWEKVKGGGAAASAAVAPLLIAAFDIECNSAHGDFPVANKDYRRLAIDLQQAWEAQGMQRHSQYDAKKLLEGRMLEAFFGDACHQQPPAPPRLYFKRPRAFDAPKERKAALDAVRDVLDDVYAVLKDSSSSSAAGGAAAKKKAQAPQSQQSGGGNADDEQPEDTSAVGRMVRTLNGAFAERWPLCGDEVIQIGTTFGIYGSAVCCERHVLVLGTCEPVPGATVRCFEHERDLLLAWVDLVAATDPDVVLGYNIFGFDMAYLFDRARELLLPPDQRRQRAPPSQQQQRDQPLPDGLRRFCRLGRLRDMPATLGDAFVVQQLSSSALGDNELRYIHMHGRVVIDLMKVVQRDHRLDSYKLDAVAEHFTGQRKHDVSPNDVFRMQRGTAADRAVIAAYCVQDCELCNVLTAKLEILANNMGMANVCSVPLSFIFMRGQGVKIFSLVAKFCRADGFLVPTRYAADKALQPDGEQEDEGYEGAIVLPPQTGMYLDDPVSVLDYNSLYPSSMISHNLSHDSLVIDPAYDNLPGVRYVEVTYDSEAAGKVLCRYARREGAPDAVLPRILRGLLAERKQTRKRMEYVRVRLRRQRQRQRQLQGEGEGEEGEGEAVELVGALEGEPPAQALVDDAGVRHALAPEEAASAVPACSEFETAVMDGLQLALKVTSNSLYGQTGARTSPLYLKHIAACTTAVGRQMILLAKDYVESHCGGRVVYGDSVPGYTPVVVRQAGPASVYGGRTRAVAIEDLGLFAGAVPPDAVEAAWRPCGGGKEALELGGLLEVWTDVGWTPVQRVVRHALAPSKRVLRVRTGRALVHVTDDHSLLRPDATPLPAGEATPGTSLLHAARLPSGVNFECGDGHDAGYARGSSAAPFRLVHLEGTEQDLRELRLAVAHGQTMRRHLGRPEGMWNRVARRYRFGLLPSSACHPDRRVRSAFLHALFQASCLPVVDGAEHQVAAASVCLVAASLGFGVRIASSNDGSAGSASGALLTFELQLIGAERLGDDVRVQDAAVEVHLRGAAPPRSVWTRGLAALQSLALCGGCNCDADDGGDDADDEDEDDEEADTFGEPPAPSGGGAYVYDLTTGNHRFQAGVGSMVVHNTDSIFITFDKRAPDGTPLAGRDALANSIARAQDVSTTIRPRLPPPHNLAYEKTFFPFLLLSKKRYVGLQFGDDPDAKPKQKSMGIALKRRDYAPVVKAVYGGLIDIVLQHRDVPRAVRFLTDRLRDLAEGRYDLDDLIISKTLRSYYKFPQQIAHWVLATRMFARDPGSAPQVNDRIPYVFVEAADPHALMGDRIEHIQFVRDRGVRVDTAMYIQRQIMKPCTQLLAIALEKLPGYRLRPELSGPKALDALVAAASGDAQKARERLDTLREREVERLLFEPVLAPMVRARNNRCNKQNEITSFFKKAST